MELVHMYRDAKPNMRFYIIEQILGLRLPILLRLTKKAYGSKLGNLKRFTQPELNRLVAWRMVEKSGLESKERLSIMDHHRRDLLSGTVSDDILVRISKMKRKEAKNVSIQSTKTVSPKIPKGATAAERRRLYRQWRRKNKEKST